MGRVKKVDLYENGTIAIVEAVSPELGNRVQRVRVQLPGTSAVSHAPLLLPCRSSSYPAAACSLAQAWLAGAAEQVPGQEGRFRCTHQHRGWWRRLPQLAWCALHSSRICIPLCRVCHTSFSFLSSNGRKPGLPSAAGRWPVPAVPAVGRGPRHGWRPRRQPHAVWKVQGQVPDGAQHRHHL